MHILSLRDIQLLNRILKRKPLLPLWIMQCQTDSASAFGNIQRHPLPHMGNRGKLLFVLRRYHRIHIRPDHLQKLRGCHSGSIQLLNQRKPFLTGQIISKPGSKQIPFFLGNTNRPRGCHLLLAVHIRCMGKILTGSLLISAYSSGPTICI